MTGFAERVVLGRSGLEVSKLGLGSSFGAPTRSYLEAYERGVNYFYWGSLRRSFMADAIREIAGHSREKLVVVLQSYSRSARFMDASVERAIRRLGIDYGDVLLLGWHNKPISARVLDQAQELLHRGRIRAIAVSSHRRPFFLTLLDNDAVSIWHVRYNAVHRGAEREVFSPVTEQAPERRPGLVSYTNTRWGHLCDPKRTPAGEVTPNGTDCYRFALSHPAVDLCIAGPNDDEQMKQALDALDGGVMDEGELAWMRRVGDHIYGGDRSSSLRDSV